MNALLLLAIPCALLGAGTPGPGEEVAALYKAKCLSCHGADGKGDTPAGRRTAARSFRSPEVMKLSDAVLIECTTKGRNKMPGYGQKLTAEQIRDLVKYLRTLK